MSFFTRWRNRLALWRDQPAELNKRAQIESFLLECAAGKRPLPDAATCRWLALRLGTPKAYWSDALKQPPSGGQGHG